MTASRNVQRVASIMMLAITVAFCWFIAAALDLMSPRLKWFVFPAIFGTAVLMFARSFTRDVRKYVDATKAYAQRAIDAAGLPATFRFITHETTLREVTERLGSASRVVELALRHGDGDTEHFKAYEYDLPYRAAVLVMPQRPFAPEDTIRAVHMRKAPADDWLTVES